MLASGQGAAEGCAVQAMFQLAERLLPLLTCTTPMTMLIFIFMLFRKDSSVRVPCHAGSTPNANGEPGVCRALRGEREGGAEEQQAVSGSSSRSAALQAGTTQPAAAAPARAKAPLPQHSRPLTVMARPVLKAEGQVSGCIIISTALVRSPFSAHAKRVEPKKVVTACVFGGGGEGRRHTRQGAQ